MMGRVKRIFLSEGEFKNIQLSLEWEITEFKDLSPLRNTPGIQRKEEILGAFISGDSNNTKLLNSEDAIAGMDVLVYEPRPKKAQGEGLVNVYHYVVTKGSGDTIHPYCLHGPFTKEALQEHWPDDLDTSPYDSQLDETGRESLEK